MRSDELDFSVPPKLVAQQPCEPRDAARLLVVGNQPGQRQDMQVRQLGQCLRPGDLLVRNNTKVFPARLFGHKDSGGAVEVLLVHPLSDQQNSAAAGERWRCLIKGRVHAGSTLIIADGCRCQVEAVEDDGHRLLRFAPGIEVMPLALSHGAIPLPPYIRRQADERDRERYQSVFAREPGSVAAPTASLHFTPQLLEALAQQGVGTCEIELRVGPGTFKPVTEEQIQQHPIHQEWCHCPQNTLDAIAATRAAGGRVVALGTTVVRCLESAWQQEGGPKPFADWTRCFLYPPHIIRSCDYLMTNFHLPRSTLLALVACLIGVDELMAHYQHAIAQGYRLFSYGDAMLIPNRRLLALRP